jgi:hypothetical protein
MRFSILSVVLYTSTTIADIGSVIDSVTSDFSSLISNINSDAAGAFSTVTSDAAAIFNVPSFQRILLGAEL